MGGPPDAFDRLMLSHVELVGRVAVASVLGGLIGWQRDLHGKPVGLRTHAIVGLASATFMVVSSQMVYFQHFQGGEPIRQDPSRIAASVVAAIGFLAGGAIIRTGVTIQHLTTAAGLWLVTAIGLASGAGMWIEAVAATVLGYLVLSSLRAWERHAMSRQRVTIVTSAVEAVGAAREAMVALGARVNELRHESARDADRRRIETTFDVQMPEGVPLDRVVAAVEKVGDIERVKVDSES